MPSGIADKGFSDALSASMGLQSAVTKVYEGVMRRGEVKRKTILLLFLISVVAASRVTNAFASTLTLSEGLRLAVENSRLVKEAVHEEGASEADTLIARSKLLPSVDTSLSQTFLAYQPQAIFSSPAFGTNTVAMSEKSFLTYSLGVQQTLYDFRGNASKYEASKVILETKKLDTKRIRNLAAINFAIIYFDLLESQKMVNVAEQEVDRVQSHLKVAKSLYEEGVITKNDLLQAEVRLSDSRQRLLTARNVRAVNESRLNNALVRPLKTPVEGVDIKMPTVFPEIDLEKAWETARSDRPEIRIVTDTLRSLDLEQDAKKAEYYPKFIVNGSYDYQENRYQLHEGNWALTFGMSLNLFNGGKTRAEIAKIDRQKMKLVEEKDRLVDEIKLEVEKYVLDTNTARERVSVTKDSMQQAEENLRINRVKYEEGVGTATDVLDAVTLLTVAETNHYRAVYDLGKSEAAVYYSMGKDLLEVYR